MLKPEQKYTLNSNSRHDTLFEAWVKFITRFLPYYWFVTLTFKDDIPNSTANRIVARYMRNINEDLYGRRFRNKGLGLPYILARERQKRGTPHFHLLVGGDCWKLLRKKYKQLWEGWNGETFTRYGMARIEKYNRKKGARMYVAKYVMKGGEIDVNIPPCRYELYGLRKSSNLELQFPRA